jgi:imidazolonepropionase-like amidohydrolase
VTDLLLYNCSLIDVRSGEVQRDVAVRIEGEVIASLEYGSDLALAKPSERALDLGGSYLLPGLINCHVHFGLVLPGSEGERFRGESESALALRMAANAVATLRSGVTTVRLVGERPYADIALRDSIARGETLGPRILTSGPLLIAVGGHGWEFPGAFEASGPEEFRRAVREQIKHGVDWIKISVSGGIAGEHEAIADAQMSPEEIRAVTDTAHACGRKVAAHAGPAAVIETAVQQKVDCIEHGYFLNARVAELMAASGTWLVPTINVSRAIAFYEKIGAPAWMVEKALAAGELHWAGLQHAIASGVQIALGTDMMPHEPFDGTTVTVREIEFMVEAGMSSIQAIQAATLHAAELLEISDKVGSIQPGKSADLIAVGADPLADIAALRDLQLVVSRGRVLESG